MKIVPAQYRSKKKVATTINGTHLPFLGKDSKEMQCMERKREGDGMRRSIYKHDKTDRARDGMWRSSSITVHDRGDMRTTIDVHAREYTGKLSLNQENFACLMTCIVSESF